MEENSGLSSEAVTCCNKLCTTMMPGNTTKSPSSGGLKHMSKVNTISISELETEL